MTDSTPPVFPRTTAGSDAGGAGDDRPADADAFAAALAACGHPGSDGRADLAVACSGGADSLGLALLARDWAAERGARCLALVVDHGLRPEAAAEAAATRDRLTAAGIEAQVLTAEGPAPTRGLQAAARTRRYALMLERCRAEGVPTLAVAHHREDQAETFLLRLARGSGVDGLAAMAPTLDWGGVRIVRPLLDTPRARVRAVSAAAGLGWVEDPSNADTRFQRVRLRRAERTLADLGLDAATLAATAARMGRARAALEGACDDLEATAVRIDPAGYAEVDADALARAPAEVALRLLARLVCRVGGRPYPPRLASLERAHAALLAGRLGGGRTLAGVVLRATRDGRLRLMREAAAVTDRAPVTRGLLWDRRFALDFAEADPRFEVGPLGRDGWSRLRRADAAAAARGDALPGAVRPTLPALWTGGTLALVPHLQDGAGLVAGAPRPRAVRFAGPDFSGGRGDTI